MYDGLVHGLGLFSVVIAEVYFHMVGTVKARRSLNASFNIILASFNIPNDIVFCGDVVGDQLRYPHCSRFGFKYDSHVHNRVCRE